MSELSSQYAMIKAHDQKREEEEQKQKTKEKRTRR
jgi:hypothetical protein